MTNVYRKLKLRFMRYVTIDGISWRPDPPDIRPGPRYITNNAT